MNPILLVLTSTLLATAGSASVEGPKVPRPLPRADDSKPPAVVPVGPVEPAPAREIPGGIAPRAALPPKAATAAGAPEETFLPDFSVVRFDEPGDGALWVRGRTYKARFDADGATYVPFLGSSAPRNFPLEVGLASVTVGGAEVELARAAPTNAGSDVVLERGAIREVWHMGLDAAEQTFVIDARPAGDLELRLAFESDLAPRATADGLEFDGPSGGVRISAAVAVDADGRRHGLATRLEPGRIAIALPASISDGARFPLVIDPVYSSYGFETGLNASGSPDIANSGNAGTWCAVYAYTYSQTDIDVWAQDVYYGQPVAGTGMWVDYTGSRWYDPRIAYNALHDTFLTVSGVYDTNGRIMARAHQAHTTNQYLQKLIQPGTNGDCHSPDVGGDPALIGPTYFFCVWTRNYVAPDQDIHGRLIDWDGTPLGTTYVPIENSGAVDAGARISKTDGQLPYATQRWNIAWTRTAATTDVYGAQISWDGQIATSPFAIDATAAVDSLASASSLLDGATGDRPWMVTFTRDNGDLDVMARVLVNGTNLGGFDLSVNEYAAIYEDQSWSDVDTNGQRFAISYCETYLGNPADRDQYVATVRWNGSILTVDEGHQNVDYSTNDTVQGQISGGMNATSQGYPYYGLAWPRYGSVGDTYVGAYYEPALVEATCFGDGSGSACPCGNYGGSGRGCANSATNGAYLYEQGHPWLSSDDVTLTAYGLPATAACLFFQGTGIGNSGTTFGDGIRCMSGAIIRIATKAAVNGTTSYPQAGEMPISQKGLLPADGGYRGYQAWYRNPATFCTADTFNMSSGMRIIWVR